MEYTTALSKLIRCLDLYFARWYYDIKVLFRYIRKLLHRIITSSFLYYYIHTYYKYFVIVEDLLRYSFQNGHQNFGNYE